MTKLKIEMLSIDKIKVADYNPRKIENHAFQGLIESVKRFGLQQPLIINKKTGNLVSGHQRFFVCQHLQINSVPVVYVDLNEIEEKAMNITMNNKAIEGDFTEGIKDTLAEIQEGLGEDYIFDLNLDDILKDLPQDDFIPALPEDEGEEKPAKKNLNIIVICEDILTKEELFSEFRERGLKIK